MKMTRNHLTISQKSCQFLNNHFPGQWIGQERLTTWPPHSPDVTPLNCFMGAALKIELLVSSSPTNLTELRTEITDAVAKVTPEMQQ